MFRDLPIVARELKATPDVLERVYQASRLGLRGDALALRAGMLPVEFARLKLMDPMAEMAEMKGRAEGEYTAAKTLHEAAADGDTKAALDILKHQHGWVAKQQIDVSVDQTISVISALEKAQTRVIEGLYTEVPQLEDNTAHADADLLRSGRNGVNVEALVPDDQG